MKFLKPHWVSHDGRAIFSIDLHPDGSRFVTGGQGQDCGLVNIWNMSPVRSEADETDKSIPKVLCEMSNHQGCVNSVRWSMDGKWLASGGDDALVMIWQIKYQGIRKSTFGGTNHEQWGCVSMLRGHSGDILGVAWSHDHKYLASCSVDNTIIIWNAQNLPQIVSTLSGHKGLVKGITWDPVGKYLASQADDRSVRVWRTNDWKEVQQITKPFSKCGGTTHVLRLSWSPDGKFVVTAHALNNDGPTAQIIERGDWKSGIDFVGHRKAVEVVAFNPHLFIKKNGVDNHGVIALGSRDRSLSIWLTSLRRPLVVIHDLFEDSILDLSWSKSGYELMVCSIDGSIAYFKFTDKELGVKLSEQALDEIFISTYGSKRKSSKLSANTSTVLIEDPAMLNLVHSQSSSSVLTSTPVKVEGQMGAALNKGVETVFTCAQAPTITKQIETKTSDGRRRITPVTVTSQPTSLTGAPLPFTSFSPKQNKGVTMDTSPPVLPGEATETSKAEEPSSLIKSPPPKPMNFKPLSSPGSGEKQKSDEEAKSTKPTSLKRRLEAGSLLPKAKKLKRTKSTSIPLVDIAKPGTPQKISSTLSNLAKQAQVLLSIPEVEKHFSKVLQNSYSLDVDNGEVKQQVSCRKADSLLWSSDLSSSALLVSGNESLTCVLCSDKSVNTFSTTSGRRLLPKFHLSSLPHAIKVRANLVMTVCARARVNVWDIKRFQCSVKDECISHLLQDGKKISSLESVELTENGVPAVTIKGTTYTYHTGMCTWVETSSRLEESENHFSDLALSEGDIAPLRSLQVQNSSKRTDSVGQMLSSLQNPSKSNSASFLENQISRSYSLQSPVEYKHWSIVYVRHLVKEGSETKLRDFCQDFTTPTGCEGETILGMSRQSFLRDLLAVIAENASLQRLYHELRDTINIS